MKNKKLPDCSNRLNKMKINEVPFGYKFSTPKKGEGVVIDKTARTITAKFAGVTTKVTYRNKDAYFSPSDF